MRSIPWSEEAEQALLGSMLLDKEAADTALDIVTVNDFYMDKHREVFAAIAKLRGESQPVDAITITQLLRDKDSIDSVGGAHYISTLVNTVPTAANVKYYADIVKEKSMLRRVIAVGQNAIQMAYDQDPEAVELLQAGAFDLDSRISAAEPVSYTETCSEVMDILTERYISKSIVTGVPTGFVDLDERTAGLQPSELIILGGRPSMGKSVMAQCIAENAAREGHSVLLAILEDTRTNLLQRSIARLAKVDLLRLRKGQIRDEEWTRVSHALGELQNLPAWFLGPVNVKVPTIRAAARKLKREQQLDLIIVDYLQLLADGDDSNKAVGETSRQLKALAQELEVPVLAVAQLSRSCETRSDKRPTLADLRDSGQIEQDADVVMFVYRDEYYYGNTSKQGIAEIIIAKQRNGPVGTVELQFDERFVVFRDLAKGVLA